MFMPLRRVLVPLLALLQLSLHAQNYHAFNGSSFAGVESMYNNPSSTVHQAYKWDVQLFGVQSMLSNQAFQLNNNSLPSTGGSTFSLLSGLRSRALHAAADANLLNLRYSINAKNAVSIGFRTRAYGHLKTGEFNYSDTITSLNGFLHANNQVNFLNGYLTHAGWAQLGFNYSRVIMQSANSSLSAGITLNYIKSLSGAYGFMSHVNYKEEQKNNGYIYTINQASAGLAYSDNYLIDKNSNRQSASNFISKAPSTFGLDIGVEYLYKNGLPTDDEEVTPGNYDWKIGISIMDIGRNKFNPVNGSFYATRPLGIEDSVIQKKIEHVQNVVQLRDSLNTMFSSLAAVTGRYYISLPTRMVINIDHSLGNHFFINANASLNFYSTQQARGLHTRGLNLITLTPRWETQAWGFYLPVQYNTQGQLWVGAAVKLGPLLMGVHSLDFYKWFKTGTQTYNGGGYILLSIHPFKKRERVINELDCPK